MSIYTSMLTRSLNCVFSMRMLQLVNDTLLNIFKDIFSKQISIAGIFSGITAFY